MHYKLDLVGINNDITIKNYCEQLEVVSYDIFIKLMENENIELSKTKWDKSKEPSYLYSSIVRNEYIYVDKDHRIDWHFSTKLKNVIDITFELFKTPYVNDFKYIEINKEINRIVEENNKKRSILQQQCRYVVPWEGLTKTHRQQHARTYCHTCDEYKNNESTHRQQVDTEKRKLKSVVNTYKDVIDKRAKLVTDLIDHVIDNYLITEYVLDKNMSKAKMKTKVFVLNDSTLQISLEDLVESFYLVEAKESFEKHNISNINK